MADKPLEPTNGKHPSGVPYVAQTQTIQRNPFVPPTVEPHEDAKIVLRAALTKEYVPSGKTGYYPFLRAQPPYIDDVSQQFGIQVYERMMTDPVVYASERLFTLAMLANGWEITPSLSRDDADYEVAVKMRDFVQDNLENLATQYDTVLQQQLNAFEYGASVGEQIYYVDPISKLIRLKDIRDKPLINTIFVVDSYNNTVGILTQRFPGQSYPAGSYIPIQFVELMHAENMPTDEKNKRGEIELSQRIPGLLPRYLFSVLTNEMRYNDERGHSGLRAAYSPWWFKQQIVAEYLSFLSKFASPSLVGTTAQNAQPQTVVDESLDPTLDPATGLPQVMTPEQVMANSLSQFQNGTAMAIPFGAKVEPIKAEGTGEAFATALNWANAEIVRGITFQFLATSEGMHNARAASDVHQDILSLGIQQRKRWLAAQQRREVFYPLLRYNFDITGKQIQRYVPKLNLGMGDGFPLNGDLIAKLASAKYLDPSQYTKIDERIGLPQRESITVNGVPTTPSEMQQRNDEQANADQEQMNTDRQFDLQAQQKQGV